MANAQGSADSRGFNAETGLGLPAGAVLVIDFERVFNESAFGRRIAGEIEAELAVLTAENRRIEAELREEELALTERRKTMEPEAFKVLTDAFDAKVQDTRQEQGRKFDAINSKLETGRAEFIQASEPVLEQIMEASGANAILERGSVILAAPSADITGIAISRIDAVLGAGGANLPDN
jgi:Skp family chaperone for outer membrane proteins